MRLGFPFLIIVLISVCVFTTDNVFLDTRPHKLESIFFQCSVHIILDMVRVLYTIQLINSCITFTSPIATFSSTKKTRVGVCMRGTLSRMHEIAATVY